MPVLLYVEEAPGRARVTTIIHQPDKVGEDVVASGISVDAVPEHSINEDYQRPVLYVNPDDGSVWYEGKAKPIGPVEFKTLFTRDERKAFRAAVETDEDAKDFYDLVNSAGEVRLNSPLVVEGINFLVSIGVITQARANELLALGA